MQLSSKTSGVSLHISKHKGSDASINGLQRHNEREPGSRHSNKRIDDSRTADNVILKRSDGTYYEQVSAIIDRNRDGGLKMACHRMCMSNYNPSDKLCLQRLRSER